LLDGARVAIRAFRAERSVITTLRNSARFQRTCGCAPPSAPRPGMEGGPSAAWRRHRRTPRAGLRRRAR
jgi:hypothetical protein